MITLNPVPSSLIPRTRCHESSSLDEHFHVLLIQLDEFNFPEKSPPAVKKCFRL
ncbi:hypothetical protein BJ165DRAFT_1518041 [Panaeolus papilionaceus]|nr:hypothetical protein BJ165DRAFT_1518041 [Panaeolus papilionaceus]